MERVQIRLDPNDPSPRRLMGYFAEVFAALDAAPRLLRVEVEVANSENARVAIDFEKGEPVFRIEGRSAAHANFRLRWLAEHPVPLRLPLRGRMRLIFTPTTGNRVKVSLTSKFRN